MRKKKQKQAAKRLTPQASGTPPVPAHAVESAVPAPTRTLDTDLAVAKEMIARQAWGELLALGQGEAAEFPVPERERAARWLLRVQILAVTEGGNLTYYDTEGDARTVLVGCLRETARITPRLHETWPFGFNLYLQIYASDVTHHVELYRVLLSACSNNPDIGLLARLRAELRALVSPEEEDAMTREEMQLVLSLGDLRKTVDELCVKLLGRADLTAQQHAWLQLLRTELAMDVAPPWESQQAAAPLRAFAAPSAEAIAAARAGEDGEYMGCPLTVPGWAFLYELASESRAQYPDLLSRYIPDTGCVAAEALKMLARCAADDGPGADQWLRQGVRLLMAFARDKTDWFDSSLLVVLPDGAQLLHFGGPALYAPHTVPELLLQLAEQVPDGHPRADELMCLYRVYAARDQFETLDADTENDLLMPGLEWLCLQEVEFQYMAGEVLYPSADRAILFLGALVRALQVDARLPGGYYAGDLEGEDWSAKDGASVLDALDRLAPLRARMEPELSRAWIGKVKELFASLSHIKNAAVQARALQLARVFEPDLVSAKAFFCLGYLEQQPLGDPHRALDFYLRYLAGAKEPGTAAPKNARILWHAIDRAQMLAPFITQLEAALPGHPHAPTVGALLKDARERYEALMSREQYLKTAVNRWPSLTAPARKLLGVLAVVDKFSGYDQLGQFAGMEEKWARIHYEKLVKEGMVLEEKNGTFSINPHLVPLIEREGQHAVVGRIVRSQGTSAAKQVFNSQREFTIYQVMLQLCPNQLVFPNCSLQSVMSYERMKELVNDDDFGYYLRASVDIVVVSSTTYLPMLAIEVDSVWHDTERQQVNDGKKDRLFAAAGIPFMRLQPVGNPSENVIRGQVAQHLDELVRALRLDMPGYEQARGLLEDLSGATMQDRLNQTV